MPQHGIRPPAYLVATPVARQAQIPTHQQSVGGMGRAAMRSSWIRAALIAPGRRFAAARHPAVQTVTERFLQRRHRSIQSVSQVHRADPCRAISLTGLMPPAMALSQSRGVLDGSESRPASVTTRALSQGHMTTRLLCCGPLARERQGADVGGGDGHRGAADAAVSQVHGARGARACRRACARAGGRRSSIAPLGRCRSPLWPRVASSAGEKWLAQWVG